MATNSKSKPSAKPVAKITATPKQIKSDIRAILLKTIHKGK